jgi:hypothetical protein
VAAIVKVAVALAEFLIKYVIDLYLARRHARLARVNEQLSDFYGPLLALTSASNRAWQEFRSKHRCGGFAYWSQDPPPSEEDEQVWRTWMTAVFIPLNRQMRDVVITKAHLVREGEVGEDLLKLCAHVSAYEACR